MIPRPILVPLGVGLTGLAVGLVQVAIDPRRALFAYAAGFAVALTIALGSLLFLMIAQTARARWFVVLQRLTGAIAATLPLLLLLFLPIALGVRHLYAWAGPPGDLDAEQRAWVAHVHPWLNVPFFVVRSYVYLGTWSALALILRRTSLAGDTHPSEALVRRARLVSALGLPIMAFTLTFASFDWIMSLNPRWASDMMGVYLFAGALTGTIAATSVAAWLAWRFNRLPAAVGADHFHALGRVLFMTVIFWAYIAFCQFVLIWIADMARETTFYVDRSQGSWGWTAAALVAFHFVVPFLLLVSRSLKRTPGRLAFVGGWLICAHALDLYWLVLPPLHAGMSPLDLAFLVGPTGVCAALGAWLFLGALPVPAHDPALAESLRYESP